jgi:N-methylhydantoinase B
MISVDAQIIFSRLRFIPQRMGAVLLNTARSPFVSEDRLFAAALFDGDQRLVSQTLDDPFQMATLRESVRAAFDYFLFDVQDGDVIVLNDSFFGGSDLTMLTVVFPLFIEGELRLFPGLRLRLDDLAGEHPGGFHPGAFEPWQEGLRLTPLKLYRRGVLQEDILRKILANSRTPERVDWSVRAGLAACRLGAEDVRKTVGEYGIERVLRAINAVGSWTKERIASSSEGWLPGSYRSSCTVHYGAPLPTGDAGTGSGVVRLELTVGPQPGAFLVDFEGTDPQAPAFINSPLGQTRTSVLLPFYCALAAESGDGQPPELTETLLSSVEVRAPRGSLVNPRPRAATGWCASHVGAQISGAVAAALGHAGVHVPFFASTRDLRLTLFSRPGKLPLLFDSPTFGAPGAAASRFHEGWGNGGVTSNRRFVSVEETERRGQYRIHERTLLEDRRGKGTRRGGPGMRVVMEILGQERLMNLAFDAAGAADGGNGEDPLGTAPSVVVQQREQRGADGDRVDHWRVAQPLAPGERLVLEYGGGSGWVDSAEQTHGNQADETEPTT